VIYLGYITYYQYIKSWCKAELWKQVK